MNPVVTFLAPPILGAFIGYMTNYVAIKMLFRPLKPWRLFGLKIPMTPGVIPAKRYELADNIGEMVGDHLLTSKDISRGLTEEGFQEKLSEIIESNITQLMEKDLGPVQSLIPHRFREDFNVGVKILQKKLLRELHNFIDSDNFSEKLTELVNSHLDEFLDQELKDIFSDESMEYFCSVVEKSANRILASKEAQEFVDDFINKQVISIIEQSKTANDILPKDLINLILDKIDQEAPKLLDRFARLLKEPHVRDRIVTGIRGGIDNFITSLGPLAALAGNFLNPHKIENSIRDYLNNKEEEIHSWLTDEEVRQKITSILQERLQYLLDRPISEMVQEVEVESIESFCKQISAQIVSFLQQPLISNTIADVIRNYLKNQKEQPVSNMMIALLGEKGTEDGKSRITAEIVTIVQSDHVKKMLDDLVTQLRQERLMNTPVGMLSEILPARVQTGLEEYILQRLSELLVREVPDLVDSLNIRKVVADKVNTLDLLRLEGLLLGIMEEQFKYINLFGALLGFLIGCINLVFLVMN